MCIQNAIVKLKKEKMRKRGGEWSVDRFFFSSLTLLLYIKV